jgi:carbon-monoxide dehydrogenase small subunit
MSAKIVNFTLNERSIDVMVTPLTTLQSLLRDQLGYTATKIGCRQGGCGSCTVLLNGDPVSSCLVPVENVAGQNVITLEGLSQNGTLHPIQESFYKRFAVQCGYCSPGMILTSKALLDRNPQPSSSEIAEALSGNLCRCTGYKPIIEAVQDAAKSMQGGE